MSDLNTELLRARWNVHQATARVTFTIYLYGDELGKQHEYGVGGLEAVALYLSNRDGIPPERTLSYKTDLLSLLLSKEMTGWAAPLKWSEFEAGDTNSLRAATWRLLQAETALDYSAECFADHLAETGNLGDLSGEEALRLYLINKHHWHPTEVSALSIKAMREVLAAEMKGWTMTREQVAASRPEESRLKNKKRP